MKLLCIKRSIWSVHGEQVQRTDLWGPGNVVIQAYISQSPPYNIQMSTDPNKRPSDQKTTEGGGPLSTILQLVISAQKLEYIPVHVNLNLIYTLCCKKIRQYSRVFFGKILDWNFYPCKKIDIANVCPQ